MLMDYNRTINDNGAYFYEPDFLVNNAVFYNATKVTIKLDYLNQGFGVLVSKGGFQHASLMEDSYGIFLVEDAIELVRYIEGTRTVINKYAYRLTMPVKAMTLEVYKNGDYLYVMNSGKTILYTKLDESYTAYGFGFYSNRWNTIHSINYQSNTPQEWDLNVLSSKGGKIQFYQDGFSIVDARSDVQVEQSRIHLPAGKYYLTYSEVPVEGQFDIKCYAYYSDDEKINAIDKNILKGNRLELSEDAYINVHFCGQYGAIEQIAIKKFLALPYVGTTGTNEAKSGSLLQIDLDQIVEFELEGRIVSTPITDSTADDKSYYYVKYEGVEYREAEIRLGEDCLFSMLLKQDELLSKNLTTGKQATLAIDYSEPLLYLLHNLDAIISRFVVRYKDGREIDYLNEVTDKYYVPNTITSPVLAVDEYYEPLDLSSSYRIIEHENGAEYAYTNREREWFTNEKAALSLEKSLRTNNPDVVVYGIPNGINVHKENIYRISEGVDTIENFAAEYDMISPSDYQVDTNGSFVILKNAVSKAYAYFVVDYLKERSYAINYNKELQSYEVDISSSTSTKILYDFGDDGSVRQYISTGFKPDDNKYIVLSI